MHTKQEGSSKEATKAAANRATTIQGETNKAAAEAAKMIHLADVAKPSTLITGAIEEEAHAIPETSTSEAMAWVYPSPMRA